MGNHKLRKELTKAIKESELLPRGTGLLNKAYSGKRKSNALSCAQSIRDQIFILTRPKGHINHEWGFNQVVVKVKARNFKDYQHSKPQRLVTDQFIFENGYYSCGCGACERDQALSVEEITRRHKKGINQALPNRLDPSKTRWADWSHSQEWLYQQLLNNKPICSPEGFPLPEYLEARSKYERFWPEEIQTLKENPNGTG